MQSTLHTPIDLGLTVIIACGQDAFIKACVDQTPHGDDTLRSGTADLIPIYIPVYQTKMHAIRGSFITT